MNALLSIALLAASCTVLAHSASSGQAAFRQAPPGAPLTVMTYNVRLDTDADGENAWPHRRDLLASQVRFHHPDVVGTQEALPHQVAYLDSALVDYAYVGEGREGGDAGEYAALFYDRHRFRENRSGTFWLSETPDTVSVGWDAALPRVVTWAELEAYDGGERLLAFNTHFDHVGAEARRQSAELLVQVVDSLNRRGLPTVVMGDLNLTPETPALQVLAQALTDAYAAAPVRLGPAATFEGFAGDNPGERRIDYVFVTPGVRVEAYATLTDVWDGRHASDHYPVMARLDLQPRPLVIAHRGASGHAPENTLAAFGKAVDLGADMMELDVFTLADGEVVCFHDDDLERLTGQPGDISAMTLPQLQRYLVGGVHAIPTLRQALDLTAHRLRVNVELKGEGTAGPTYAVLQDYIRDSGASMRDFHVSSFRHDELRRMRELDANIEIGVLPNGPALEALDVAREVDAASINAHHGDVTAESLATMHAAGLKVYTWTVNDRAEMRRLTDLGVDGIITNYPERALQVARK